MYSPCGVATRTVCVAVGVSTQARSTADVAPSPPPPPAPGDLCGGCDGRPGAGARFSALRALTSDKCLSVAGGPSGPSAQRVFVGPGSRPFSAAKSARQRRPSQCEPGAGGGGGEGATGGGERRGSWGCAALHPSLVLCCPDYPEFGESRAERVHAAPSLQARSP